MELFIKKFGGLFLRKKLAISSIYDRIGG